MKQQTTQTATPEAISFTKLPYIEDKVQYLKQNYKGFILLYTILKVTHWNEPGIEWHLDIYPVVGGHEFQVRLSTFKKKPTDDKAFAVIKKYFPSVRRIVKKFEDRK